MITLLPTHSLRIRITAQAMSFDVTTSYIDNAAGVPFAPGCQLTQIVNTMASTTIVSAPPAGTVRLVERMNIMCVMQAGSLWLEQMVGATAYILVFFNSMPNWDTLEYEDGIGFRARDQNGKIKLIGV